MYGCCSDYLLLITACLARVFALPSAQKFLLSLQLIKCSHSCVIILFSALATKFFSQYIVIVYMLMYAI